MFPEKIKITDELIQLIIDTRKEHNLTAYQLSEKIGKNKSWLPNIENKRTKNISRSDLYLLFKNFADEENLQPEQYIVKNLPRNCMIELEDGVTAPCYHVKEMLGVDSWKEYISLSPEEHNEEDEFYENRSNDLREKDISASVYRLSNILSSKLQNFDLDKKEDIIRYIDRMADNLENDFDHALDIYGLPYCPDDPISQESNAKTDYLKLLESLSNSNSIALDMMCSRSFVYSFIEGAPYEVYEFFSKIENWKNLTDPEDEKLYFALEDVKNYQFCVFSYIEDLAEYNKIFKNTLSIDYDLIFSKLYEIFRLYIKVAKIDYSFDLPIPDSNSNISELHQKTDKIIFDIEKEMRSRYRNRNSLW